MNLLTSVFSLAVFSHFLALEKLMIGSIPFYALEIIFLGLGAVLLKEKLSPNERSIDKGVLLGVVCILLGALFSTLLHPWESTELGRLKSWFLFPTAYFLVGIYFLSYQKRLFLWVSWFFGSSVIAWAALYGYFREYITYDNRLAFPYTSPNFLAYLVIPSVLIGFFFLRSVSGWIRGGVLFLMVTSFFVLYQTHSYNSWLALLGALGIVFLGGVCIEKKKPSVKVLLTAGSIFIMLMGSLAVIESNNAKWTNIFEQSGRSSLDSRVMIWQSALAIGGDYPLNGIGVGNFQEVYLEYQNKFPPYLEWAVPQPHNFILAVWLQTGLLGLLGMGILLGRLGMLFFYRVRENNSTLKTEYLLIIALWVSFFFYGAFDTPYFRNDLAFLFWIQVLLTYMYSLRNEH